MREPSVSMARPSMPPSSKPRPPGDRRRRRERQALRRRSLCPRWRGAWMTGCCRRWARPTRPSASRARRPDQRCAPPFRRDAPMVPAGAGSRAGPRAGGGARGQPGPGRPARFIARCGSRGWPSWSSASASWRTAGCASPSVACTAGAAAAVPVRPVCGDDRAMAGEHRRRKRPMIALWRLSNSQDLRPGTPPGRWQPRRARGGAGRQSGRRRVRAAGPGRGGAPARAAAPLLPAGGRRAGEHGTGQRCAGQLAHRPAGHARAGQCLAGARRDRCCACRRRRAACSTCSMPSTRNWRNARSCRRWPIPTCRI